MKHLPVKRDLYLAIERLRCGERTIGRVHLHSSSFGTVSVVCEKRRPIPCKLKDLYADERSRKIMVVEFTRL